MNDPKYQLGASVIDLCLWVVILVALVSAAMCAPKAHGQEFRVSDQVYIASISHAATPWLDYHSDVWIANETGDPVSVSWTFIAANAPPVPAVNENVIHLAPYERREFVDLLAGGGGNVFGMMILSGCLEGTDCGGHTGQYGPAMANYRSISAGSRSYSTAHGQTASIGQNIPALTWWSFGDPSNPLRIVGLRASDKFRTNLVLANISPYSACMLTIDLYDGASVGLRDHANVHLDPLESRQVGILDLFPKLAEWSRLNRTRAATNAFVVITQSGVTPAKGAAAVGCPFGCPGFIAIGSLIDIQTGDPTTLEATFARTVTDAQVVSLFASGGEPLGPPQQPQGAAPTNLRASTVYRSVIPTVPDPWGPQTALVANQIIMARSYVRMQQLGAILGAAQPVAEKALHRRMEKE